MEARGLVALALSEYRQLVNMQVIHLRNREEDDRRRRRVLISSLLCSRQRASTGAECEMMLNADDGAFAQHFRVTRTQFEFLLNKLQASGLKEQHKRGLAPVPVTKKVLMFLWYMSTSSSFRAISEKFGVSQSSAHRITLEVLNLISSIRPTFISWPGKSKKSASAAAFSRLCGLGDVIGAIDGCHIRVQKPPIRGGDYKNCHSFYSVLLQAVVDDRGRFIDVFAGTPGGVQDARMLESSTFYTSWKKKMGDYSLLGDEAYAGHGFPFIIAPKRDNGAPGEEEQLHNSQIGRGRAVVERALGRMKCRWRRLQDLQHTRVDAMVMTITAGCVLHNMCLGDSESCQEHPQGCPRQEDGNQ
ncbi:uncharacterized protein LOC133425412 [Cololabis saira]|uniref:uncharacterized protein LOC133425412 n=1 Tax=Cololabis saira TaxID=129043 RepID=UPI002AD23EE9|nr:uncharacterized protein LOC133425412 [Cololabis saira]